MKQDDANRAEVVKGSDNVDTAAAAQPAKRKGPAPLTIEEMQEIAAARGGLCLSTHYVNANTPLEWECTEGHRWRAAPSGVKHGNWCAICVRGPALTLTDMQCVARERGGRCLSERYVNSITPMEWECADGHRWFANAGNVRRGAWCSVCGHQRRRVSLADIQSAAAKLGGRCLSEKRVDATSPLLFECSAGHRWEAKLASIRAGMWCAQCRYDRRRTPIETMHSYAASHGGQCLSEAYTSKRQRLRWRCAKGDEWESTATIVKQRTWCPQCAIERGRTGIDRMHEIAVERGGRCLSVCYVNAKTRLNWQCAAGHAWEMTPSAAQRGRWCIYCSGSRHSLGEMQALARARGGECVSDTYVAVNRNMEWRCGYGHTWSTKPAVVLRGHWCPECAILERSLNENKRRKYQAVVLPEEK
jgi:hypothetical protein